MSDKDKQQTLQNLATQMQLAQDTIKQVEEELKKLGVSKTELPEPKKQDMVKPGSTESVGVNALFSMTEDSEASSFGI